MVLVDDDGVLVGLFTDGDLRRLVLRGAEHLREPIVSVMTRSPRTLPDTALVQDALRLIREHASYVLFNAKTREPVEIHDAARTGAASRFYYAMEPLHFGRLGGAMWVKLIWGFMGLSGGFLAITGFMIYALRTFKPIQRLDSRASSSRRRALAVRQSPGLTARAGANT